ncbi:MAG: hypothetical protein AB7G80_03820 [Dongiaceae bacterium]
MRKILAKIGFGEKNKAGNPPKAEGDILRRKEYAANTPFFEEGGKFLNQSTAAKIIDLVQVLQAHEVSWPQAQVIWWALKEAHDSFKPLKREVDTAVLAQIPDVVSSGNVSYQIHLQNQGVTLGELGYRAFGIKKDKGQTISQSVEAMRMWQDMAKDGNQRRRIMEEVKTALAVYLRRYLGNKGPHDAMILKGAISRAHALMEHNLLLAYELDRESPTGFSVQQMNLGPGQREVLDEVAPALLHRKRQKALVH